MWNDHCEFGIVEWGKKHEDNEKRTVGLANVSKISLLNHRRYDFVQSAQKEKQTDEIMLQNAVKQANTSRESRRRRRSKSLRTFIIHQFAGYLSIIIRLYTTRGHNKFKCRRNEIKQTLHPALIIFYMPQNMSLFFLWYFVVYVLRTLWILYAPVWCAFLFIHSRCTDLMFFLFFAVLCRYTLLLHSNKLFGAYFLTILSEI